MATSSWIVTTTKPTKPIPPRTKREKAIATQEFLRGNSEGYVNGVRDGREQGAESERKRSEALLCKLVKAATKGEEY